VATVGHRASPDAAQPLGGCIRGAIDEEFRSPEDRVKSHNHAVARFLTDLLGRLKSTTVGDTIASANLRPHLLCWALLAVCLLYMVQLWTPLRLNGDAIELLSIASSAADGHGFLDHGQKTHYPPGYPAMVVCLDRVGEARPWSLVGLNALFLFVGFISANYVARHYFQLSSKWGIATLLFTALSFALIKHFTLTLTDIPFFGISMIAAALMVRAERESGASYYIFSAAALSISIVSVLVRPIAIALFPCLVWSLGAHLGFGEIRLNKRILIGSAALAVVLAGSVSVLLLHTKYVQEALSVLARQGLGRSIRNILLFRVHEIGELSLNAPASKLGVLAPLVWVFGVTGTVALAVYVRHCRMGFVEVYLAAYMFILLLWPYGDTRFWTPVLPLMFAELFSLAQPWTFTGWKKYVTVLYSAVYALMGLVALAYSTWITFSGREFPRRYGDDHLRPTYELFYSDPHVDRSRVYEPALELLQRYSGQPRHYTSAHK
jgi:hypothetical protein